MLKDKHGRTIDYLRISVTDRCDLRCISCMPTGGVPPLCHNDILRFEEIEAIVRTGSEVGIKKARLTGGEPLIRLGIVALAKKLRSIQGLDDLALTTNGSHFAQHAAALLDAGVRRVNFGIPSLGPAKYSYATRIGNLQDAIDGLECALQHGFSPIKINVVVMRGINDDLESLRQFAALAAKKPVHVRFIEYMPIGDADHAEYFVPSANIGQNLKAVLADLAGQHSGGQFQNVKVTGAGPARDAWRPQGWPGSMATISTMTGHVCGQCNRLRLTADGHLRPCLFSKSETNLKPALRPTINADHLKSLFLEAVENKPSSMFDEHCTGRKMSQIGG